MSSATSSLLENCKLTYFGLTGARGEASRLALAIGNISYTDHRISFAEWKDLKATTPWGSLPMLTFADSTMPPVGQQRAILRLIGHETGLYPRDDYVLAARVDEVMDATEDLLSKTNAVGQGMEQDQKVATRKAAMEKGGIVYGILDKMDTFIGTHGTNGHSVGNTLTIADLLVYSMTGSLVSGLYDGIPLNGLESFANIMAVRKTVRAHPAVVQFYDGLDDAIKEKVPASFQLLE